MVQKAWKSILVAVRDPARRDQPGIRKAARLATATGARLTLFHAFATPWPLPHPLPADTRAIIEQAAVPHRSRLDAIARRLRAGGVDAHSAVAWDFPPVHAIVRRVLADRPDVVFAESQRHTPVARLFLANADWELIRECPCPVWFVRGDRLARRPTLLVAVDPTHAHAKPSRLDDRLLAVANQASGALDGRMAVLHAEEVPPALAGTGVDVRAALARLAARHGLDAAACSVRAGAAADVLPAACVEARADVLVMGAVSRSGLAHFFIGSTAETVIDAVGCDVLVVKPAGFRARVPRRPPHLPASSLRGASSRAARRPTGRPRAAVD
jgi:universal stress protein E